MQRNSFKGYKLEFTKSALKDLKKLDSSISKKIRRSSKRRREYRSKKDGNARRFNL